MSRAIVVLLVLILLLVAATRHDQQAQQRQTYYQPGPAPASQPVPYCHDTYGFRC